MEKEKEKNIKGSEDLKPQDDQVLLEDNDGEFGTDILEDCFDYEMYGNDVAMEHNVYFTDKGAIMLF